VRLTRFIAGLEASDGKTNVVYIGSPCGGVVSTPAIVRVSSIESCGEIGTLWSIMWSIIWKNDRTCFTCAFVTFPGAARAVSGWCEECHYLKLRMVAVKPHRIANSSQRLAAGRACTNYNSHPCGPAAANQHGACLESTRWAGRLM